MATLRPDPTFYPSARQAMEAPPEQLAYLAMPSPSGTRPDAIGVVDVNPDSRSFGQVPRSALVGRAVLTVWPVPHLGGL